MRNDSNIYPDYSAELEALDNGGFSVEILQKILQKHQLNAQYNQSLEKRYKCLDGYVPIFNRTPRFEDDEAAINNKINNDFFSEIIDMKVGYFAGKAIGYSYSTTDEAKETTGGDEAVKAASKALTDFVMRNNMYGADMETTKNAAICGYSGRLFYIDTDGYERVLILPAYECITLSDTSLTEPRYGVRYYRTTDINDNEIWKVEFYDNKTIKYFEGSLLSLKFVNEQPHLFDYCPLQIVPNNEEMLGDAEKVLPEIDSYDRAFSDCANEIESFANAYMVFENINATDEEIKKAQKSGSIKFHNGTNNGKVYFLTKDNTNSFLMTHLDRTEDNIYRFSKTPNLNDESFGSASGISLKFKLTAFETKCGMFQAKMSQASQYMFKVLASSWKKKRIAFDPLQVVIDYKRNFPLDLLSEAQAVGALKTAGFPDKIAYAQASFVDDVQYILDLKEEEINDIKPLDSEDENNGGTEENA